MHIDKQPCRYCSPLGLMCKDCEIIDSGLNMGCEGIVFKSIKERIRNLRGGNHDC